MGFDVAKKIVVRMGRNQAPKLNTVRDVVLGRT